MRFRSLRLLAFGPFSGRELVLGGDGVPRGALQIVYGANEAGKSTALRAITGLLFGIPMQTRDAHVHKMTDLRIGAVLEAADGHTCEVVRRKGNKNTLLDPEGNVLDEALLRRLCGATTEATFRALHGLDHESLREGAAALLAGKGDVGESLFDAAVGAGRGIHRVLLELEAEADALFTPLSHKRKLNEACKAYLDARSGARDRARSGEAWVTQTRALAEARAERERLAIEARAHKKELHRLERTRRLLPLAAKRSRVLERQAALGPVVRLGPEAGRAREATCVEVEQAQQEIARLDADIAQTVQRRQALVLPPWLDDPQTTQLSDLTERLGAYRKAHEDRPRLAGALAAAEADAEVLGARVGVDATPNRTLVVAEQARVRALALEEAALVQQRLQTEKILDDRRRRRTTRAESLAAAPPVRDTSHLRALLRRIEREGDLDTRHAALLRERDRLQLDLARRGPTLGLSAPQAPTLLTLVVPSSSTVDRFATDLQALDARQERLREEEQVLTRRRADLQRRLGELARGGEVPSARALTEARGSRAQLWGQLREAGRIEADAADRFERSLARADEAADRLWREAERVARAETLEAEQTEVDAEMAALQQAQGQHQAARLKLDESWRAAWAPAGIKPGSPTEMRDWLRRLGEAIEVARRLDQLLTELHTLETQRRTARRELGAALGEAMDADEAPLAPVCDRALALVERWDEDSRRREELRRELDALDEELGAAERDHQRATEASTRWRQQWAEAVAPLGLGGTATAAEATAVLDAAGALGRKLDECHDLRRRLAGIDRDALQFEDAVGALVSRLAPDLAGRPAPVAAETLQARYREGLQARRDLQTLDEELRRREEARRAAQMRRQGALDRLRALMEAAQVTEVPALEAAERRADEARELARALGEIDDQILGAAEGLELEAALAETRSAHTDDLDERLEELRAELELREQELQQANRQVGSIEGGLVILEQGGAGEAADLAASAQEHAARVRNLAERYAQLRLAARLLSREVERYREQHQGPVLTRASGLLAKLTDGRYTGLRADFDDADKPVLRCLREDGTKVPVEGLSDGTRDQLYLALRLSSLEQRATTSEPLPLVLDDILIHFDDQRAGAALEVLADHARATQVVLFTHHARVVALAEAALTPARLHVLRLE